MGPPYRLVFAFQSGGSSAEATALTMSLVLLAGMKSLLSFRPQFLPEGGDQAPVLVRQGYSPELTIERDTIETGLYPLARRGLRKEERVGEEGKG